LVETDPKEREPVKLIVGLGNPGVRYRFNRHNMGFLVLERLADQSDITLDQKGCDARFGRGNIADEAVLLAEPQIYMNMSGRAVKRLFRKFNTPFEDLIVIHDDLDLPFGTIRLKAGGGHGGHKGLVSIIDYLGGADFSRIRLGIGKPAHKAMVEDYVLEPFTPEERQWLPHIMEKACDAARELISSGIQTAMRKHHGKIIIMNEEV